MISFTVWVCPECGETVATPRTRDDYQSGLSCSSCVAGAMRIARHGSSQPRMVKVEVVPRRRKVAAMLAVARLRAALAREAQQAMLDERAAARREGREPDRAVWETPLDDLGLLYHPPTPQAPPGAA